MRTTLLDIESSIEDVELTIHRKVARIAGYILVAVKVTIRRHRVRSRVVRR
jgi:hypothetical protein